MTSPSPQLSLHHIFERPVASGQATLASRMGVSIQELKFLAFSDRARDARGHYTHFEIPKKSGGVRHISAPVPRLMRAQHWIAAEILTPIPVHGRAHGFLEGRSIATNAAAHVGRAVVVNMDIEDFFPSIHYHRVRGLFASMGYEHNVAELLAMLCTEPPHDEDGTSARAARCLPQGAPTSPPITNLICRRLDARLQGLADSLGMHYTRYADDMTFSCDEEQAHHLGAILKGAVQIIREEGFSLNEEKTRVLRKGQRQDVTGVVVNEKLNIARRTLKRFRALLFQIERDGPEGKWWGDDPDPEQDVLASIEGFASFVYMIDRKKGAELLERVNQILAMYPRVQHS